MFQSASKPTIKFRIFSQSFGLNCWAHSIDMGSTPAKYHEMVSATLHPHVIANELFVFVKQSLVDAGFLIKM